MRLEDTRNDTLIAITRRKAALLRHNTLCTLPPVKKPCLRAREGKRVRLLLFRAKSPQLGVTQDRLQIKSTTSSPSFLFIVPAPLLSPQTRRVLLRSSQSSVRKSRYQTVLLPSSRLDSLDSITCWTVTRTQKRSTKIASKELPKLTTTSSHSYAS